MWLCEVSSINLPSSINIVTCSMTCEKYDAATIGSERMDGKGGYLNILQQPLYISLHVSKEQTYCGRNIFGGCLGY